MTGIFKLRFEWRLNKCVNVNCLGGFSTIKSTRTKGRVAQPLSELGTSMITPKFDPATPLHRTAMRTQKAGRLIFFSWLWNNSEFKILLAVFSRSRLMW